MVYLLVTSLLWAFSFGLIKGRLAGVDPYFSAALRLGISLLLFLPWLRVRGLPRSIAWRLIAIGGLQFGLMYVFYFRAFEHLAGHEVALFTVLTPLYIGLFSRKSARRETLLAALVACAGAGVIAWKPMASERIWTGFLLVQCANACFAFGQLSYKRLAQQITERPAHSLFALTYLGGLLVAASAAAWFTPWDTLQLTTEQGWTLLYLGLLPAGLGFYLWNIGATRVGEQSLAVMNNVKVPLAVFVSLTFFGESTQIGPLILGAFLLALALWFVQPRRGCRPGL